MYTVDLPYPQLCTLGFNQLWSKNTRKTIPENPQSRPRFATHQQQFTLYLQASLGAQTVKHLSAMGETQVRSLYWEDLLEKEVATHSSTLAWKIPWVEEPGRLQSMGLQ